MPGGRPNILVLWGDDIGITNLSCYSDGLMGYRTPNIDRIAEEGARFTDYYGEQSCTAGRAAFITGQNPYRTGLTKVGMPGADIGIRAEDPTIATALKEQGYATGQFGKNHFGDRDEFLPTAHGFDEFFGNLYHLNAEEEPEDPDYPDPEHFPGFRERFGPRGVLHSWADGRIEDTGPLTRKRMETIDEEVVPHAQRFIRDAHEAGTPFFLWFNTTGMHFRTHIKDSIRGQAGRWQSEYHDAMVEHDRRIGEMLGVLDELGIAEDTIVLYSTDNGPHMNTWPDAAMTPFRNEKNSCWEGAFRVPSLVRWPGTVEPGTVLTDIVSHADWFPTLLRAAGAPGIVEDLKQGHSLAGRDYRVHLDGNDQTDYLSGESPTSARDSFFYVSDDGDLMAMRFDNWKMVFLEQRATGTLQVWAEPFTELRVPKVFNLRTDPFERADVTSNTYYDWVLSHAFLVVPAQAFVMRLASTLQEFPPRQESSSFTVGKMLAKLQAGLPSS
ncbi:arylsulfatase [Aquipuribacter nitratireducens]|uniref:Arylsulfatase n=1 Tax=Aquipuribacter nitratireducens TaxID=650104 RepID=A0ABW0GQC1_9MICO